MAVLTTLSDADVASLLRPYGIASFRASPTASGVENTNYFVTATDDGNERELVLTLMESPAHASGWLLPDLLDAMQAAGLPTPVLLHVAGGGAAFEWQGRRVILCTRVPGAHRERVSADDCAAIGRFMARMHRACSPLVSRAPVHPRDLGWLRSHVISLSRTLALWQRTLLDDGLNVVTSLFARPEYAVLPEAVVHGDLFRDNALFTEAGLSGVIDFHHAARHKRAFDIAVALSDWCMDATKGVDATRAEALLSGYHAIAPLTDAERALMPLFMCYAALAFTLSRLQGHVDRPANYGKSPLPMLHRLAACVSPPWPVMNVSTAPRFREGPRTVAAP